jgi:hypothetical protein
MLQFPVAAHRHDMWMLNEEQSIAAFAGLPGFHESLLNFERICVSHAPDIQHFDKSHVRTPPLRLGFRDDSEPRA